MGNKLGRRRAQIDDRFTRPQGLYQHKDVDHKKLRRLIIDAKLAPCYPGAEDTANDLDECPICFLHYPSLNRSKCCTKGICTECFLQVKSPNTTRPTQCPFCKTPNYAVEYRGAKTQEEKGVEQAEEQKVIEAKIRIRRQQEIQDEEARIQRQEHAQQVESPRPTSPVREEPPAFPVFAGSAYTNDRPVEQLAGPERSWNAWTNMDSTAIGYPQPDFFNYHTSRADTDSPWQRNQRDFSRHHPLSSSSSFTTRRRGAISGEPGQGPGAFYNREEDFDLDLEDIMVMEAIWLSIQEQGSRRPGNNSQPIPPSPFSSLSYDIPEAPPGSFETTETRSRRGSVTGGFASAIAALAERQVTGSDQPSQSDLESNRSAVASSTGDAQPETQPVHEPQAAPGIGAESGKGDKAGKVEQEEGGTGSVTMHNNVNNMNSKASSNGNLTRWIQGSVDAGSDVLLDQGSEVVEAGTSFCSSVPSASELPWEAPESGGTQGDDGSHAPPADSLSLPVPREMLPESFEEQMMLAMALSLAEAQARSKAS